MTGLAAENWEASAGEFTALAARSERSPREVAAWLGEVQSDAIGYAGCEILRRLVSGDLVVPLAVLGDRARERAAGTLLDLAIQAVLHRAEMTVHDLCSSTARMT